MNAKTATYLGLIFIAISQILLSFGFQFLMSQKPFDYTHWLMLIGALLLFALWFSLPSNVTKKIGLNIMTLGIGAMVGMCVIDFFVWSLHDNPDFQQQFLNHVMDTSLISIPFLIVGPALFYSGICISTYGLIKRYPWQVILLNIGGLMIGLGHPVLHNAVIAAIGSVLLLMGIGAIVNNYKQSAI